MPEWLLSVISGSWLGGSPVSALSFVASFTLLYGPFVLFRVVFGCFFSVAILKMTHKMSSCILYLRAGSDPTSLCFVVLLFFVVWCVLCLFALFVVWILKGPLTGLCICPLPVIF